MAEETSVDLSQLDSRQVDREKEREREEKRHLLTLAAHRHDH